MILHLRRDIFGETATLGQMLIDYEDGHGRRPFGYVVEDVDRGLDQAMPLSQIQASKIKARTAIPTGHYPVRLEHSGKYGPDWPTVVEVPGYRYIRIHSGNSSDDTEGCIMVGKTRDPASMTIGTSRQYVRWLVDEIRKRITHGEAVWLVIERDPATWPTP